MHRNTSAPVMIVATLVLLSLFGSCSLLSPFLDPLAGTWVSTATDGYYDANFSYHVLYSEETLVLGADGTITVTSFIEDRTFGGRISMSGAGTYTHDDDYFSATIELTTNDFGNLGTYTLSGSYLVDGNRLTIYYDGQTGGTKYYRQ